MALRNLIIAVCIALVTAVGLAPAMGRPLAEEEILKILGDLRSGSLTVKEASSECLLSMSQSGEANSSREVLSTYFEVSASDALPTFCGVLMQAAKDGSIAAEDLAPIIDPQDQAMESFAMGRLLRVVYFYHHGISPALLSEEAKR